MYRWQQDAAALCRHLCGTTIYLLLVVTRYCSLMQVLVRYCNLVQATPRYGGDGGDGEDGGGGGDKGDGGDNEYVIYVVDGGNKGNEYWRDNTTLHGLVRTLERHCKLTRVVA